MNQTRRAFLGTSAAVGSGAIAGCLGGDDPSEPSESPAEDDPEPPEPPVIGDPEADVTVVVYEDFACPACQAFKLNVFPALGEQYLEPGSVRYEHRDFPVIGSSWSWELPSAAREVFETEGDNAFWAFTSRVYEHQGSYSYEIVEDIADEVGADGADVREAAEEDRHRSAIEAQRSYGRANGISGTPTVVVDGDPVEFYDSETQTFSEMAFEETADAIDAALE
ncbi:DsbA family protein [Halobiforma nitratireducens]|uniref:Disulfide bond formation protein n=1 Tax=Halobiforma nitratireducens JCM 10879 TaxID=1227454 RepID=M0LXL4_9EURY|nr:thioredoxin domain-containing protein [Halobiforma nitratireducens]EMA36845.1 disulfide bond formation protein [Halobiforma nitratireducens JCM 10879]